MFEKIMRLVKERGLTLNRLGRETGISSGNIYDWKSGRSRPKLQTLQKLADYFKVPVSYFIENDDGDEDGKVVQHIHDCEISGEVNGVKHVRAGGAAAGPEGLFAEVAGMAGELAAMTPGERGKVADYIEFIKWKRRPL